ncbi:PLP-dependent aminotransferase family protein [Acetobacter sacchari]|uniref:PLP-dependent aminotransferase family protein n=1 Tax=Acetobacter sacchari TaxID=2661687 RepID=A0ABS3LRX4_9PROT|nr:PLP-dependent aminotransferase family protein [Acetobacter sacchari]MBO1358659.1 PLP-dependent aminotransferase family protein [Acetobacter sacchari]
MTARGSRTADVVMAIRARISSGALGVGDRLPSVRRCADAMGVSPSTVVEAYDRLVAEGAIRARAGSGFYVAGAAPALVLTEAGPQFNREIDPLWVSRQSLDAAPDAPRPGCGWLPAEWMPGDAIRRAMRAAARGDDALLAGYSPARGSLPLRRLLARQFAAENLPVAPDQILLTGSGSQALDLVCRLLLRPGDTVLVDDPCYFNFRALLRAHRANVVGVPYEADGPNVEQFAQIVAEARPRLYVTNSALHNPTGATISPRVAHRVLNIAAEHDMIVVEDDIFTDFEPEPSPRLATLDGLRRVIRIGSFSKTLSASLRCGYIVSTPEWIEALTDLQVATCFSAVCPVAAEVTLSILSDGGYRKHMEALRRRLATARRETTKHLGQIGIVPHLTPRGGFYLWCALPDGVDAETLARVALRDGLVLAPGDVFSVSRTLADSMRFNVGQMGGRGVYAALRRAVGESVGFDSGVEV